MRVAERPIGGAAVRSPPLGTKPSHETAASAVYLDAMEPVRGTAVAAHADARGLSLLAPISRAQAEALLPPGFELVPIDGTPKDQHLLWMDMSEIQNGKSAILGIDHGTLARGSGAVSGGALGIGFGLAAGALSFGLLSPLTTYVGARVGARLGRAAGEAASALTSKTFGTYEEVLVTLPNVRRKGSTGRYNLVLGMRLNSFWGRALEKAAGYGFHKVAGDCGVEPFQSYSVRGADGAKQFQATLDQDPSAWSTPEVLPDFGRFERLTQQPFLGVLSGGRFAVSRLERDFHRPSTRVAPANGKVTVASPGFIPGVPQLSQKMGAQAFLFDGVHERLSWPRTVRAADL
ncbi:MAG: hypothetical protein U1E65_20780 [Myxococcota bacterium]